MPRGLSGQQSASGKQQTWTLALTTQGLAVGTWLLPVTVTDKTGTQSRGSAALLIFAGNLLNVGSGQPYATVADAITAASSGDTLVLADGTYTGTGNKNLVTGGKSLYYASAGGPAKAIIDCAGAGKVFDATAKLNGGAGFVAGQLGNLSGDPLFASGPKGSYYLAQTASSQAKDSPAVNPGGGAAASLFGWGKYTTRTDGAADAGALDWGWH